MTMMDWFFVVFAAFDVLFVVGMVVAAMQMLKTTQKGMEKAEGHPVPIIPQASVVPAGVVRLSELQEQGWSYIRP